MSKKAFSEMTAEELAAATREYDGDFDEREFKALGPAQRARWERAKRKRGRPTVGKGAKVISVSVEKTLLAQTDRLARRLKVSRASLISAGLRSVLKSPRLAKRKSQANGAQDRASRGASRSRKRA